MFKNNATFFINPLIFTRKVTKKITKKLGKARKSGAEGVFLKKYRVKSWDDRRQFVSSTTFICMAIVRGYLPFVQVSRR